MYLHFDGIGVMIEQQQHPAPTPLTKGGVGGNTLSPLNFSQRNRKM